MKTLAIAMLCVGCSLTSLFAVADEDIPAEPPAIVIGGELVEVEEYSYDAQLDIKRVISVKADTTACGLVPADMLYEDSKGEIHDVRYMIMGYGCSNG